MNSKKRKKTVKEWFNTLPPNLRDQAIYYTAKSKLSKSTYTLQGALAAFNWKKTVEGSEFWSNLARQN